MTTPPGSSPRDFIHSPDSLDALTMRVYPSHDSVEMNMGLTHITARICDLAGASANPFEAEFLVDTGSIDCMAPGEKLRAAGVRPEGKRVYEPANGQPI